MLVDFAQDAIKLYENARRMSISMIETN